MKLMKYIMGGFHNEKEDMDGQFRDKKNAGHFNISTLQ